jgi:hypothetical protein
MVEETNWLLAAPQRGEVCGGIGHCSRRLWRRFHRYSYGDEDVWPAVQVPQLQFSARWREMTAGR